MNDLGEDYEVITGCAAAHPDRRGGQHVARSCTAVMIIHTPTGIAVRVDDERSQLRAREVAWAKLQSVLSAIDYWGDDE